MMQSAEPAILLPLLSCLVPLARSVQASQRVWWWWLNKKKARGGSKHLEFLIQKKIVRLSPSEILRTAYMEAAIDTSIEKLDKEIDSFRPGSSVKSVPDEEEERMLLSKSSGQLLAGYIGVPELAVEVERAVWQVEKTLKARQELREEKAKLDAATRHHSGPDR